MVSSIAGTSLAQSLPARVASRTAQAAQETAAVGTVAPANDAASVPSAQSAATARVGGELDAQFDAARVQRAQDGMAPAPADEDAAADAAQGAADTEAAAAAKPAGGGAPAGGVGGASGGSDSASTDYIAEADTNNDRKLSEEERIAYEKKQASAAQSRAQEVQQAYLPQDSAGAQLDIEA